MNIHRITRIGVFYDGGYFSHVSDHYRYHHERKTRISIQGFHDLIRDEVGKHEQTDARFCRIVEAHYFRGRFPADEADRHGALLRERKFEDVLIRVGVTPHFLLMPPSENGGRDTNRPREKGIDVWLALEAFELAEHLDVVVLVTGDGDFVKLVQKLNARGIRSVVTVWEFEGTRTASTLLDAVTYEITMEAVIAERARRNDPLIEKLFMPATMPDRDQAAEGATSSEAVEDGEEQQTSESGVHSSPSSNFLRRRRQSPAPSDAVDSDRSAGEVVSLPVGESYGFIAPDSGGENLFVHCSEVEDSGFRRLEIGSRVAFSVGPNPMRPGDLVAKSVVLL